MIKRLVLPLIFAVGISPLFARQGDDEETPKEPSKTLQSIETEELRASKGDFIAVEGKVFRLGSTSGGGINFLNMSPDHDGFVAIVYGSDVEKFPDGLEAYQGATVRVTGELKIFRDVVPQIVVKSPDQIEVLEAAAEEGTESDEKPVKEEGEETSEEPAE